MTKKDYQKIVNALALAACDNVGRGGTVTVMDDISFVAGAEQAVIRLALALADDNPSFDLLKFYRAFDVAVEARIRFLADNDEIGSCDDCGMTYLVGSQIDHDAERGLCWPCSEQSHEIDKFLADNEVA